MKGSSHSLFPSVPGIGNWSGTRQSSGTCPQNSSYRKGRGGSGHVLQLEEQTLLVESCERGWRVLRESQAAGVQRETEPGEIKKCFPNLLPLFSFVLTGFISNLPIAGNLLPPGATVSQ